MTALRLFNTNMNEPTGWEAVSGPVARARGSGGDNYRGVRPPSRAVCVTRFIQPCAVVPAAAAAAVESQITIGAKGITTALLDLARSTLESSDADIHGRTEPR